MRRGDLRRWKVVVGGCFNQNLHPFLALCELGETSRLLTLRPVDRPVPPPHTRKERGQKMTAGRWGFGHRAQRRVVCKELIRSLGVEGGGTKGHSQRQRLAVGVKARACPAFTTPSGAFVFGRWAESARTSLRVTAELANTYAAFSCVAVLSGITNWEKYDSPGIEGWTIFVMIDIRRRKKRWKEKKKKEEGNVTYHHHECRNPGGSPRVMFFSHRI